MQYAELELNSPNHLHLRHNSNETGMCSILVYQENDLVNEKNQLEFAYMLRSIVIFRRKVAQIIFEFSTLVTLQMAPELSKFSHVHILCKPTSAIKQKVYP